MSLEVPEYSRLLATLNNAKALQKENPALYQFLKDFLLDVLKFSKATATELSSSTAINNVPFLLADTVTSLTPFARELLAGSGVTFDDSVDNERTISAGGGVPFFVPADETYVVPQYVQALFTIPIDIEGIVDVNGILVWVD